MIRNSSVNEYVRKFPFLVSILQAYFPALHNSELCSNIFWFQYFEFPYILSHKLSKDSKNRNGFENLWQRFETLLVLFHQYSVRGHKNCHRTRSLHNVPMCILEAMKFSTWDSLEIEWILPKFLSKTGGGATARVASATQNVDCLRQCWPFWLKLSHIGPTSLKN